MGNICFQIFFRIFLLNNNSKNQFLYCFKNKGFKQFITLIEKEKCIYRKNISLLLGYLHET